MEIQLLYYRRDEAMVLFHNELTSSVYMTLEIWTSLSRRSIS